MHPAPSVRRGAAAVLAAALVTIGACAPTPGGPAPVPPQVPGNPDITFSPLHGGVVRFDLTQSSGEQSSITDIAEEPGGDVFVLGTGDPSLVGSTASQRWWWKRVGADGRASAPTRTLVTPGWARSRALATQADGSHLLAGVVGDQGVVIRVDRDGVIDPSFGTAGQVTFDVTTGFDTVTDVEVASDGSIVVGLLLGDHWSATWNTSVLPYQVTAVSGTLPHVGVARLLPTGQLDPSFGTGGLVELPAPASSEAPWGAGLSPTANTRATRVAVASDGSVVVAGAPARNLDLLRLDPSGVLDPTFGTGGATRLLASTLFPVAPGDAVARSITIGDVQLRDGGGLLIPVRSDGPNAQSVTTAWTDAGALDPTFDGDGILNAGGQTESLPGGKMSTLNGQVVRRYLADGAIDTTFGTAGALTVNVPYTLPDNLVSSNLYRHHVRADGKLTVAAIVEHYVPAASPPFGPGPKFVNTAHVARVLTS